jgi:hypothetical protein
MSTTYKSSSFKPHLFLLQFVLNREIEGQKLCQKIPKNVSRNSSFKS